MNDYVPLETALANRQQTLVYVRYLISILAIILLAGSGIRFLLNARDAAALQAYTSAIHERTVLTTQAKPGELSRTISLPTSLRGNTEAVIYARSSGYVKAWYKGIGDQVKTGELLATIDAPEQEQELAQARAQREQIAARLDLAQQTLTRWEALGQRNSVISQQDLAEKRSAVRQGQADMAAASANVKRLEQLESFRRIIAPFNGIITRRSIEVGDLIATGGKELFALAQTDLLRLTIWVPQAYANDLKVGTQVNVNLNEHQDAKLKATVERIAGGIDPQTRSRQVDLTLPNPGNKLLPGAYAEISITLSNGVKTLVAPASVLIISDQNPRVAIVDKDNRVGFSTIKLGRDLGRDVEILEGIHADDLLIVSPSDQLVEGDQVKTLAWQPITPPAAAKAGTDSQPKKPEDKNKP